MEGPRAVVGHCGTLPLPTASNWHVCRLEMQKCVAIYLYCVCAVGVSYAICNTWPSRYGSGMSPQASVLLKDVLSCVIYVYCSHSPLRQQRECLHRRWGIYCPTFLDRLPFAFSASQPAVCSEPSLFLSRYLKLSTASLALPLSN
jgi:hypothetical protein